MEKFIKETALKAEDFLNSAVSRCERNTNPTTAALNAEFALGKYFALMDIVKSYDMDLYISVATSTKEAKDKLSNIVNNIYSVYVYVVSDFQNRAMGIYKTEEKARKFFETEKKNGNVSHMIKILAE